MAAQQNTVERMLQNHRSDSFADDPVEETYEQRFFDNDNAGALARLQAYIDHCFDEYDIVSEHLDREQIQACVADWGRRRGQCKYDAVMDKQRFGSRVSDSAHRNNVKGHYAVFVAEALVGVAPEDDKGCGWKPTVRHELGHAIDMERRGTSDHGAEFKDVMRQFGHEQNDGGYAHGYAPRVHR